MTATARPLAVQVFTPLLIIGGLLMAYLGLAASGYFIPALGLALAAALLWLGRGRPVFTGLMLINQLSGLVLILDLWLGGPLGVHKLDVSGVALLVNLATGGPLMAILSIPLLVSLRFGQALPAWFQARGA